jgi:hypothetical protein
MTTPNGNRLPLLAAEIRAAHDAVTATARTAVERAREAGKLLIEAKDALPHGGWQQWLREVGVPPRTAQGYMQLARLPETKCATVAHLGLRAALREISIAHGPNIRAGSAPGTWIITTATGRRIILTPTGMELPPDLSLEEWADIARLLPRIDLARGR